MYLISQNTRSGYKFKTTLNELEKLNADILCFQEANKTIIDRYNSNKYKNIYISKLSKNIHGTIVYNAILTSLKVLDYNEFGFSNLNKISSNKQLEEISIIQKILVDNNNDKYSIYNCHLTPKRLNISQRSKLLENIFNDAKNTGTEKIILVGDMNTVISNNLIGKIYSKYINKANIESEYINLKELRDERFHFQNIIKENYYNHAFDINKNTWKLLNLKMIPEYPKYKMDWFIYKNIKINDAELLKPTSWFYDHKTLAVKFS